jgi:TolB-like protein/DNA-binding winged helix-turn-helix (wHTH) protein
VAPFLLRFGEFELDLKEEVLKKQEMRVRLAAQPLKLLAFLASHAGELITREEIQTQLWREETFVDFEQGVNQCVRQIRFALGDDAEFPTYIETVPRRGYRFIAPVTVQSREDIPEAKVEDSNTSAAGLQEKTTVADIAPIPAAQPRYPRRRLIAAVATVMMFLAAGTLAFFRAPRLHLNALWNGSAARPIRSLAVLPLENLSGDANQEYFADGLTEELITDLAGIRSLRVISRTSSMQYRNTQKALPQVARELNVDALVEGSVTRSGNQIRITAKLIRADDQSIWADSYEGTLSDVLALRSQVARSIVREIRADLAPGEERSLTAKKNFDPAAYDAYLLGRYYWDKRTKEGLQKSTEYYSKAIDLDPNYALAYSGLASSYHVFQTYAFLPAAEAAGKSKAAALKAISIDPSVADAYAVLADNFTTYDWNWAEAERLYRKAVELNPNDSTTLEWYAEYLNAMGRPAEAIAVVEKARQVDPISLVTSAVAGRVLYMARQYDLSIEQCKKTIEMDPNFPRSYAYLARAYEKKDLYAEALAAHEKNRSLTGHPTVTPVFQRTSGKGVDAAAYWRQRLEWAKQDAKEGRPSTFDFAVIYGHTGKKDRDKAFAFLEKAYEERSAWMAELKVAPLLDPLRDDPRFADLVRRVGLP